MGRRVESQELAALGERIRERRMELRLSQEALAEKAGISANTVGSKASQTIRRLSFSRDYVFALTLWPLSAPI